MSNLVENNDWDINRCSKPFCCKEDAEEYMQAKNFEGMVLELNDGSIQAVCPTYPEGCLLYTSPSPRDQRGSRMPSSA